ncbi:hypothetical protein I926_04180 [Pasteurella multocida subsp. multocida OH4807]|nr:hypothetical protein I926_04180 [Pasteurella multocida subsp. multocida OH4807]
MYFFNKKDNGFYVDGIHEITNDMIEITEERYRELVNGQTNGKIITSDENGPILVEPAPSKFHELVNGEWVITQEKQTQLKRELIKNLVDSVDDTAASISAKWTRFAEEYKEREAAAIAFKEANFNGEVSIYISSFATVAGLDNKSASLLILKQAEGLRALQEQLAVQRMRKYELRHDELSDEELQNIHDDIISKMRQLAEAQQ